MISGSTLSDGKYCSSVKVEAYSLVVPAQSSFIKNKMFEIQFFCPDVHTGRSLFFVISIPMVSRVTSLFLDM